MSKILKPNFEILSKLSLADEIAILEYYLGIGAEIESGYATLSRKRDSGMILPSDEIKQLNALKDQLDTVVQITTWLQGRIDGLLNQIFVFEESENVEK